MALSSSRNSSYTSNYSILGGQFSPANTADPPVWASRVGRWSPIETDEDEGFLICWICQVFTLHYLLFDGNATTMLILSDAYWSAVTSDKFCDQLPLELARGAKRHTKICWFGKWVYLTCTVSDWWKSIYLVLENGLIPQKLHMAKMKYRQALDFWCSISSSSRDNQPHL